VKTKKLFSLFTLGALCLIVARESLAQTFTTLHSFATAAYDSNTTNVIYNRTNNDGINPGGLLLWSNGLYGVANGGGTNGNGTLFVALLDGSGFTNLYTFPTQIGGASPSGSLISAGNIFYGTAMSGGINETGTLFSFSPTNGALTNIYNFSTGVTNGYYPTDGLVLSGKTLYGMAEGGTNNVDLIFSINDNGTNFQDLHSFAMGGGSFPYTNFDGYTIAGNLLLSGNTLFGVMEYGGLDGWGTAFKVQTDGSGFTTLYNFTNENDGAAPSGGLVLDGETLFGVATSGGSNLTGTIYSMDTNGSNFYVLHTFAPGNWNASASCAAYTNSDGANPDGSLTLSDGVLFGATGVGGTNGDGTIFSIRTDGADFTNLYQFSPIISGLYNSDGALPVGSLIISSNTLYGTTTLGGVHGSGSVFSLTLGTTDGSAPPLNILHSGTNVILTWPATGYTLQATTNLASTSWSNVTPPPGLLDGMSVVTNPISGARMFFRLSQ
jgi:uncharacterized repeat protein (TIGR03803 family)